MQVSHRGLIILSAVCLALIIMGLGLRISRSLSQALPAYPWSRIFPLSADRAFYERPQPSPSPHPSRAAVNDGISAQSYLIGNVATGEVYASRNASLVLPVASMSKLVTAIAVTDTLSATTTVAITAAEYNVPPDGSFISAGERYTMRELLYPMLLDSSNVAAEALASTSNRARFLELMSSYAWEIGMPATFFADPSGISPLNQSTASDFFALARYLYSSRPDILAITRTASTSVATTTDHGAHIFASIHPFVADPAFLGGKTGHTPEARDTMLTIMKIGGQPIAIIVLSSDDRKKDTAVLIGEIEKDLAVK